MSRSVFRNAVQLTLAASDFLLVGLSFRLAMWTYTEHFDRALPALMSDPIPVCAALAAIYVAFFGLFGLYQLDQGFLSLHNTRRTLNGFVASTALLLAATFFIQSTHFSRIAMTVGIVFAALLLPVGRAILLGVAAREERRRFGRTRVLIYADSELEQTVLRNLAFSPDARREPVGFIVDDAERVGTHVALRTAGGEDRIPILGGPEDAPGLLTDLRIDELLVANGTQPVAQLLTLQRQAAARSVRVLYLPHIYPLFWHNVSVFNVGRLPLLGFDTRERDWVYLLAKRAFDAVAAGLGLILLSPVFLALALLVRLDARGPILFTQDRVGLGGRIFRIFKFRTMVVEAPQYALHPTEDDDPRITRIGRWLRKTSLDELPQLWNVLRGDMSVVGPRPEMPFVVQQYNENERARLTVRPGITGVWQISPERSLPIHEALDYDLFYIENKSFAMDLAIILRTIVTVVRGHGAR